MGAFIGVLAARALAILFARGWPAFRLRPRAAIDPALPPP